MEVGEIKGLNDLITFINEHGMYEKYILPDAVFDRVWREAPVCYLYLNGVVEKPTMTLPFAVHHVLVERANPPQYKGEVLDLSK